MHLWSSDDYLLFIYPQIKLKTKMADSATSSKPPEFEPPAACVSRIIKNALPENIQITKDARAAFARAAGIFIFYLTHCANDFCHDNKRQTIYTADVINALKELDFEEFVGPLEEFLEVYRKEGEAKKSGREKKGVDIDHEASAMKHNDDGDIEEDDGGIQEDEVEIYEDDE